jgi:hypothetical protein
MGGSVGVAVGDTVGGETVGLVETCDRPEHAAAAKLSARRMDPVMNPRGDRIVVGSVEFGRYSISPARKLLRAACPALRRTSGMPLFPRAGAISAIGDSDRTALARRGIRPSYACLDPRSNHGRR